MYIPATLRLRVGFTLEGGEHAALKIACSHIVKVAMLQLKQA